MNHSIGKAAMFTPSAIAISKKNTANSGGGDGSPVGVDGGADVTNISTDSPKKKKNKKKKRNSRTASNASAGPVDDDEELDGDDAVPFKSIESPVNGTSPFKTKDDAFASTLLDLPSPVTATATSDAFADGGASAVVLPSSSPAADAGSGPFKTTDDLVAVVSVEVPAPEPPVQVSQPIVDVTTTSEEVVVESAHVVESAVVVETTSDTVVEEVVETTATSEVVIEDVVETATASEVQVEEVAEKETTTTAEVEELAETTTTTEAVVEDSIASHDDLAFDAEVAQIDSLSAEEHAQAATAVVEAEVSAPASPPESTDVQASTSSDTVAKSLAADFDDVDGEDDFGLGVDLDFGVDEASTSSLEANGHDSAAHEAVEDVEQHALPSPPPPTERTPTPTAEANGVKTATTAPPPAPIAKKVAAKAGPTRTTTATKVAGAKAPASAPSKTPTATAATRTSATKTPVLQRTPSGSAGATSTRTARTPPKPPVASPSHVASASTAASRARAAAAPPPSPSRVETEPKVVKKKLSASEVDAAGNRLYEQAMESKRRLEAKKAELENAYSFTPQVNHTKVKKQESSDGMSRFELLHEKAKESQRKKEELREQMEKELTFKPQITNKAKKIAGATDTPRYENLYKNAQEIQAKREERKKLEAEKSQEEMTFKPKIKTTKSPVKSRPLYDPELVQKKRAELEQKKLEAEALAKPKPVKKTRAPDSDNSFLERLAQSERQRAEKLAKLKQEREQQEMANATFKPKVSEAANNVKTTAEPFHQRLYDKDHLKKIAAEREQKKLTEEKLQFSFKPRVSDIPDGVKSRGSSASGSAGKSTIFERLYQDKDRVKEKIEMSEELKIQKEMEECTFRPQIEVPPTVAKTESTTPIWERLLSIDKNQIAEERERLKSQLELEACTFRPEISPTPGSLSPKRTSASNIYERLSISAGNTPVDDKKRRPSDRKSIHGASSSFNERRGSPKPPTHTSGGSPLSVGSILASSKSRDAVQNGDGLATVKHENGSESITRAAEGYDKIERSLEEELSELNPQSKSILENYDTWAASLEEKMRSL